MSIFFTQISLQNQLFFEVNTQQQVRALAITFEFGKHIDICFGNLEGHGSQNPLKMKLKIPDLEETAKQGIQKKHLVTFVDLKTTHFIIRQIFETPCILVSPTSGLF